MKILWSLAPNFTQLLVRMRKGYFSKIRKLVASEIATINKVIENSKGGHCIFIDCGVNDGTVLSEFNEHLNNVTIIGFEIQSELVQLARRKFRQHNHVHIYEAGVSSQTGTCTMYLPNSWGENYRGGTSLLPNKIPKNKISDEREVLLIDFVKFLKTLQAKSPDSSIIVKMDIEGAEYEIIDALYSYSSETQDNLIDYLMIEFHPQVLASDINPEIYPTKLEKMNIPFSEWI